MTEWEELGQIEVIIRSVGRDNADSLIERARQLQQIVEEQAVTAMSDAIRDEIDKGIIDDLIKAAQKDESIRL